MLTNITALTSSFEKYYMQIRLIHTIITANGRQFINQVDNLFISLFIYG